MYTLRKIGLLSLTAILLFGMHIGCKKSKASHRKHTKKRTQALNHKKRSPSTSHISYRRGAHAVSLARSKTTKPNQGPGTAAQFGLYVFAITWGPNFCCGHAGKSECKSMAGQFGATHFTLHGLWPNYTDTEQPDPRHSYPVYCSPYSSCQSHPTAGCNPDYATLPKEMKTYGPGYTTPDHFLADHEWAKHGSCTGLTSKVYFNAAISLFSKIPGDRGTPSVISNNLGKQVPLETLRSAFGDPKSTLLRCNAQCQLQGVGICFAHNSKYLPTRRIPCPQNTQTSSYDNGCVLQNCKHVMIQKWGQCSSTTQRKAARKGKRRKHCTAPQQGPACTTDKECKAQNYRRCARSGCCTQQTQ